MSILHLTLLAAKIAGVERNILVPILCELALVAEYPTLAHTARAHPASTAPFPGRAAIFTA
jgi:hypothetical protein